jgi:hypothetical protein
VQKALMDACARFITWRNSATDNSAEQGRSEQD